MFQDRVPFIIWYEEQRLVSHDSLLPLNYRTLIHLAQILSRARPVLRGQICLVGGGGRHIRVTTTASLADGVTMLWVQITLIEATSYATKKLIRFCRSS